MGEESQILPASASPLPEAGHSKQEIGSSSLLFCAYTRVRAGHSGTLHRGVTKRWPEEPIRLVIHLVGQWIEDNELEENARSS